MAQVENPFIILKLLSFLGMLNFSEILFVENYVVLACHSKSPIETLDGLIFVVDWYLTDMLVILFQNHRLFLHFCYFFPTGFDFDLCASGPGFDDMDSIYASPDDFKSLQHRDKARGIHLLEYFVHRCHEIGVIEDIIIKEFF